MGFFSDEYWDGVKQATTALRAAGYDWDITSSRYEHDEDGKPLRKVWTFEIRPEGDHAFKPFQGVLVASGAGSVADPLDRYDVTGYVS